MGRTRCLAASAMLMQTIHWRAKMTWPTLRPQVREPLWRKREPEGRLVRAAVRAASSRSEASPHRPWGRARLIRCRVRWWPRTRRRRRPAAKPSCAPPRFSSRRARPASRRRRRWTSSSPWTAASPTPRRAAPRTPTWAASRMTRPTRLTPAKAAMRTPGPRAARRGFRRRRRRARCRRAPWRTRPPSSRRAWRLRCAALPARRSSVSSSQRSCRPCRSSRSWTRSCSRWTWGASKPWPTCSSRSWVPSRRRSSGSMAPDMARCRK
mmetsp:Transcript_19524/g.49974  ORF Transcript_19524/g.49974 Transcript_19524/m.49974 type:complete len:266 (+) Transcript_19524:639-1436(+)